ncbi:hypothetical protein FOA52_003880 [Chlamydomonas sp. UWO 241]|nr:hypothetical protein FOA52_003880 [Chlamydomonas sp. UWO 241]
MPKHAPRANVPLVSIAALLMCIAARAQKVQLYQSCAGFMCPECPECTPPLSGSALLKCGPGTEVVGNTSDSAGTCKACQLGHFKADSGSDPCVKCGTADGYCAGRGAEAVTPCPDGSKTSVDFSATLDADCTCNADLVAAKSDGSGRCYPPVKYVGCYVDCPGGCENRAFTTNANRKTLKGCAEAAYAANSAYFGLQYPYGQATEDSGISTPECWVGLETTLGDTDYVVANPSDCDNDGDFGSGDAILPTWDGVKYKYMGDGARNAVYKVNYDRATASWPTFPDADTR